MKQKFIMCIAVFMVLQSICNSQLFAQSNSQLFTQSNSQPFAPVCNSQPVSPRNNNLVEIITLNLPDSIDFKINDSASMEVGKVNVVLLYEDKISKPTKFFAKPSIYRKGKGYFFTDATVFKATGFDKTFKAAKIRFIVGEQYSIFNLAKSEWE